MGLAASHDLLVNQNWLGASVEELVRGQLSPFIDGQDPRLRIGGPAVDLKAEAAEALGLALHELATNAVTDASTNAVSIVGPPARRASVRTRPAEGGIS